MALTEANLVIDYSHHSTPEHLEMLGVNPTRLPTPDAWRERLQHEFSLPLDKRLGFFVIWLLDDQALASRVAIRSFSVNARICTCMSPSRNVDIRASALNVSAAASKSISRS
jgi:hypothetical protein